MAIDLFGDGESMGQRDAQGHQLLPGGDQRGIQDLPTVFAQTTDQRELLRLADQASIEPSSQPLFELSRSCELRSGVPERAEQRSAELEDPLGDGTPVATCAIADLHVPLAPGSDIAFLNAVGRLVVQMGRADEHFIGFHTKGFVEYVAFLMSQSIDDLSEQCGVPRSLIAACRLGPST